MIKVFVDGQEGTTGLKIFEYLAIRRDIEILRIDEDKRKDVEQRRALINASDLTFLCLPDTAARESVALVDNPNTCIIDASTAFRTDHDWAYGLPELNRAQRAHPHVPAHCGARLPCIGVYTRRASVGSKRHYAARLSAEQLFNYGL